MLKQILVISGKGGTGKTVITGALASISSNKVMADCDVDAADLYLLLKPEIQSRQEFKSGSTACIDKDLCKQCGRCIPVCRFEAIKSDFTIERFSCEGCGLCARVCPFGAIRMEENLSGEWYISNTKYGSLVHAKLGIAEENSGKLVAIVRNAAKDLAEKQSADYVIIDGPPGIGCPVIASMTGVDCALIVTEPTLSGLHDAQRVVKLANHFKIPVKLVINKFDLNSCMADEIVNHFSKEGIQVIGKLPFDKTVVEATVNGETIAEGASSVIKAECNKIWNVLKI